MSGSVDLCSRRGGRVGVCACGRVCWCIHTCICVYMGVCVCPYNAETAEFLNEGSSSSGLTMSGMEGSRERLGGASL